MAKNRDKKKPSGGGNAFDAQNQVKNDAGQKAGQTGASQPGAR